MVVDCIGLALAGGNDIVQFLSIIIANFLLGLVLACQTTWAVIDEGEAEHQSDLPASMQNSIAKSLLVSEALWTLANTSIRVSALLSISRLFGCMMHTSVWGISFLVTTLHGLASVLEIFLICRPFSAQWDVDATGACGNQEASFLVIEIIGLGLDLIMMIYPTISVLGLPISRKKKVMICMTLDAGCIVFVITALRLRSLNLIYAPDFVYAQSYFGLLSAAGVMAGIPLCTALQWFHIVRVTKAAVVKHKRKRDGGYELEGWWKHVQLLQGRPNACLLKTSQLLLGYSNRVYS
ncbi:hypothetical protein K491DRAFT_754255 [Lophiostoma macrostomum CBS 122681]|uniref:Rhodopsin domain-containing protein n=1 Tax=Lophiostoma macrostomum CBS 122681 TaxID=1314788 RepID=A0A6A6TQ73_9PLEO|nr:hypothetical protein K491DRAFT_754255 [Lophiostoma macrostomum CBS 122681]